MRSTARLAALAAASTLALAGCSGQTAATPTAGGDVDLADGLQIVTTTTQVHDFVTQLTAGLEAAGTKVEITPLLQPGESAHGFEPTAADLTAMGAADVVVESGMGLESWLADAISASGFHGQRIDASTGFDESILHAGHAGHGDPTATGEVSEGAHATEDGHAAEDAHASEDAHDHGADASSSAEATASESADEHAGHGHGDGHDHGDGPNPHLWVAPAGAQLMVQNIAAGLEAADAKDAATIRANAEAYLAKLDELTEWIESNIETVPEAERMIVTNHDALEYFAEQFHVTQVGTIIPSWDDAAEPSAADLDSLIAAMKANGVKAIFCETQLSPATAETIASQTGAKVYSGEDALYTDALGEAGTDGGTYLGATIHNTQMFMESWGRTASAAPADLTA